MDLSGHNQRMSVAKTISDKLNQARRFHNTGYSSFASALIQSFLQGGTVADHLDWEKDALKLALECQKIIEDFKIEYPFCDLLGQIMADTGNAGHAKNLGAFYTPYHVSYAIAEMSIGDMDLSQYPKGFTMLEPCVGAGSMALAAIEVLLKHHGQHGLDKLKLTINDIDRSAVDSATYQILMAIAVAAPLKRLRELQARCGNGLEAHQPLVYHVSGVVTEDELLQVEEQKTLRQIYA